MLARFVPGYAPRSRHPLARHPVGLLLAAAVALELVVARAVLDVRALAVLVGLFLLAGILVRPWVGLAAWLAVIPWIYPVRAELSGPAASSVRATVLLLVAAAVISVGAGKRAPTWRLALPALAFAASLSLSYVLQDERFPYDASSQVDVVLAPLALSLPFLAIPLTRRDLVRILGLFAGSVVLLSFFGIHEHETASNLWQDEFYVPLLRSAGPFPHPLVFATVLGCAGMILVEAGLRARRWPARVAVLSALASVGLALAFTYSRGPTVAFFMGMAYLVLRGRAWRRFRPEWALLAGFAGVVTWSALQSEIVMTRTQSTQTLEIRFSLYRLAWRLFQDNWLYGLGVRGFAHEVGQIVSSVPEAFVNLAQWWAIDNYFLTALVEGGVLGGAAFAAMLAVAFVQAWRSSPTDPLPRIGVAMLIVIFIVSLDIDTFHYPYIAALFFLALRLAAWRPDGERRS